MIGFLSGTVQEKYPNPIILNVGGVGYAVHVPDRLTVQLPLQTSCQLYIHTHVRDDCMDLYGFRSKEELSLFELLLTVSGIGPRTGLAIIDRGVTAIQKAVTDADVDFFTTIPRLGKKNAQKIIIELKNKLGSIKDLDLTYGESSETKELLDALVALGFTKQEAMDAMRNVRPGEGSIEQKIRQALKLLGSKKT